MGQRQKIRTMTTKMTFTRSEDDKKLRKTGEKLKKYLYIKIKQ